LLGGNLSVLNTLLGTPHQPDFRGRILFLEDVDEAPYRVDRLLTHLLNAGALAQVAGVAVGLCRNCEDPRPRRAGEFGQSLRDVLRERLNPLRVPVIAGLPFGHGSANATLPLGTRALLDGTSGDLILTEAAVT
jgi:muramoyltetrapeptide carboxypeptidase